MVDKWHGQCSVKLGFTADIVAFLIGTGACVGVRLFINTYVSDTFKRFKPLRYIALIAGVTVLILRCRKDNFNYTTVLTRNFFP